MTAKHAPCRLLRQLGPLRAQLHWPRWVAGGLFAVLALLVCVRGARAETQFSARADTDNATLGDTLVYEVTLALSGGEAQSYQPPDFRGFRVLGQYPGQSTQIQMGGGASVIRTVYSWRYELSPTQSGRLIIGPAKVKVAGRELRTAPVTIAVSSGAISPPGRPTDPASDPARRRRAPRTGANALDDLFRGGPPDDFFSPQAPRRVGNAGADAFIRAIADKQKVYVGEQVVAQWFLYLHDPGLRYARGTEPRSDGFWSEGLDIPTQRGQVMFSQQSHEGRMYLTAPLARQALFPLQAGTLTVTPMEGDLAQPDFFGRSVRSQRLRSAPLTFEVMPLPAAGRPAGFDPAAVGKFTVETRLDRSEVAVGDALSLVVTISGQGNLRKLAPPPLPALPGFRSYQPKTEVKLENSNGIAGSKIVEHLLQAERPGTTIIPAVELPYFDPAEGRYQVAKSAPLRVVVTGEARPGGSAPLAGAGTGAENTLGAEIRPLRSRSSLSRDLGTTVYRSAAFRWALVLPPLLLVGSGLWDRLRRRAHPDSERGRRRRTRRLIRHHLRAAEGQLHRRNSGAFFVEIDRVLGEVLAARLGQPVAGLSRVELAERLTASGLPAELGGRITRTLDECDQARFAPAGQAPDLKAALDRAADLIEQIERTPSQRPGAAA